MENLQLIFDHLGLHFRSAKMFSEGKNLPRCLENLERIKLYTEALIEIITEDAALLSTAMDGRHFCKIVRKDDGDYKLSVSEDGVYREIATGPACALKKLASLNGFQLHDVESLFSSPVKPGVKVNLYRHVSKISTTPAA